MKSRVDEHTIAANIEVHTKLAQVYNDEPHFRQENQARVRQKLENLAGQTPRKRLLDVGCGTGFIINLAKDLFERVDGVDITPAMLAQVDTSSGNVHLHESVVESMPFEDNTFDMASAYAFLHHTHDHNAILREVARVLKPGGIFYVDLEPNRLFWSAMNDLEQRGGTYSDIVTREIDAVLHTDETVGDFDLSSEAFRDAEPIKSVHGGFDPEQFERDAADSGFSKCVTTPEWYLGQGAILHGKSQDEMLAIDNYLRRTLPLTNHLFKYLMFVCTK